MSQFAENLRVLRKSRGLSQEKLAEAIGMKRGNIASYEKEIAEPSMDKLRRLATFFEVDLQTLVSGELEDDAFDADSVPTPNALKERTNQLRNLRNGRGKRAELEKQQASIRKIIEGMRHYFDFKYSAHQLHTPTEKALADDYHRLLQLMDTSLEMNEELLEMLS